MNEHEAILAMLSKLKMWVKWKTIKKCVNKDQITNFYEGGRSFCVKELFIF